MRVEENIRLIESGRLVVPENADLLTFLLSDGEITVARRQDHADAGLPLQTVL